jgi:hypothetical protein
MAAIKLFLSYQNLKIIKNKERNIEIHILYVPPLLHDEKNEMNI